MPCGEGGFVLKNFPATEIIITNIGIDVTFGDPEPINRPTSPLHSKPPLL